ncbi:hypothetical protein D0O09_21105 [Pseudomonas putida]|jgi:hypothetical protein|nr:hypothetical protein PVLB_26972 [Pseudomonas sp. VLB120]RFP99711.1 hypothetical protein D0O09_21105 [Pseudomonas putida]
MNRQSDAAPTFKEQVKAHFVVAPVFTTVSCISSLVMAGGALIDPFGLATRVGMGVTLICAMVMLCLRPSIEAQMHKLAVQRTEQSHTH